MRSRPEQTPPTSRGTLLFALVVTVLPLASCSRTESNEALTDRENQAVNLADGKEVPVWGGQQKYVLGELARAPHYAMTFTGLQKCSVESYLKPREGLMTLGVQVKIEGTTQVEVPANPFYATLVSKSGERYESTLAGCKPALRAVRVSKGELEEGYISFHVPEAAADLELVYLPVIIGGGTEELRFDLGR